MTENLTYERYQIDLSIYTSQYKDALRKAQKLNLKISLKTYNDHVLLMQNYIQLININAKLVDYTSISNLLIKIVDLINSPINKSATTFGKQLLENNCNNEKDCEHEIDHDMQFLVENTEKTEFSNYNQLIFERLSLENVLNFIIKMSMYLLNDNLMKSLTSVDQCIGYLIILSQYSWPRYHQVFQKCITMIRTKYESKTDLSLTPFVYSQFSEYVWIPDIIEQFMQLVNSETVEFDFSNNSISLEQQNPHSTRGCTRSYSKEIRTLLINQMNRSTYGIQIDLFLEFITKFINPYLVENFSGNKK